MKAPVFLLLTALLLPGPRLLAHGDGGGRPLPEPAREQAPADPTPPPAAARPALPEVCLHRELMSLHRTLVGVGPEDDEAVRAAAAGLELGVDRLAVARSYSASRGFVLHDEALSRIHVIFRGSRKLEDWVTDFKAIPRPFPLVRGNGNRGVSWAVLHSGFYAAAEEYKPLIRDIRRLVDEAKRKGGARRRIHVSGHSLGGALSVLFAYFLAEAGLAPDDVTLFATPRVGQGAFTKVYWSYPRMRTLHYVVNGDPVPELPPGMASLPVRPWILHPRNVPGNGEITDIGNNVLNHHPDHYLTALTRLCEEHLKFRRRRLFDSFVANQKRPPTETELEFWGRYLYTEDFARIEKDVAEAEASLRKKEN